MSVVDLWQEAMDVAKRERAVARFPETVALYGRLEMIARAELELATALEKMGVKP